MTQTAKIFKSGNSQAVRLPKEFRFDVDEVEITREGGAVVLRPRMDADQRWANLRAAMEAGFQRGFHGQRARAATDAAGRSERNVRLIVLDANRVSTLVSEVPD